MPDQQLTVQVDGKSLAARPGQMLIELTDAHDIYIPRFCYHSRLSVAANCRMCLVEVEKAPKPLPACATPVMDGMVVHTRSAATIEAQKGVMEFLLINHPLDCPICDQGGECELQDLAMAYGSDVSRYQEKKRVVQDQDIGSLIQTDMTRCIHCTRCVRFGEEVAGLRELGATGRGEQMEIGTYVARSMVSELSGNVIDLCPVGALTSKPYRYTARAWELTASPGIGPHDSAGSHLSIHCKDQTVKRVAPAPCESINEIWLSNRDRFSYQGLGNAERLLTPQCKDENGQWQEQDWREALRRVRHELKKCKARDLGAVAHPGQSLEDLYAVQKFARGLGCSNIDHRVHQRDFSDQALDPLFPGLGMHIAELARQEAVLLVGTQLRKEQPMLNHRLRQAVVRNKARVALLDMLDHDCNYPLADKWICSPDTLAGPLLAMLQQAGETLPAALADAARPDEACARTVAALQQAKDEKGLIFLGNLAQAHPQFALLRRLCQRLAERTGCRLACPGPAANSAGACLAGVLPHRLPGGRAAPEQGLDAWRQFAEPRRAYLLVGLEPELDCWDGALARSALDAARLVVVLGSFVSGAMREYADVLLPIPPFSEQTGRFVNCEGRVQEVRAALSPAGEARPVWRVLRRLARKMRVPGLDWKEFAALQDEAAQAVGWKESGALLGRGEPCGPGSSGGPDGPGNGLEALAGSVALPEGAWQRIALVPMNAMDGLVRRAPALQAGPDCADGSVHINSRSAQKQGLAAGDRVQCRQRGSVELPLLLDEQVPDQCVMIHAGQEAHARLGGAFDVIHLAPASAAEADP